MKSQEERWVYVMVRDANGVESASFGPFEDRALAAWARARLDRCGVTARIAESAEARELDQIGVRQLVRRCEGRALNWE